MSVLKYKEICDVIESVAGLRVKFHSAPIAGTLSQPGTTNPRPKFCVGSLPLSIRFNGFTYSITEANKLSMGVFIDTLFEWLPEEFLGNRYLIDAPLAKVSL